MLLTTFICVPAVAQGTTGEVTPSQATITLREAFASDLKETTVEEDDGYIGIPVMFSAFRRESVAANNTVVVYIVGHGEQRVGTDSDTDIVNDLLNEGYIVTVLDYLNNPKAVGDAFLTANKNTTTDGNIADGISVSPSALGGYTSNITFKRDGGYGDVVRASLILNRSNNQNTQLKV